MMPNMLSDLIYGPRFIDHVNVYRHRNLIADVELLPDLAREVGSILVGEQQASGSVGRHLEVTYRTGGRDVNESELPNLSLPDRNALTMKAEAVGADGTPHGALWLSCAGGSFSFALPPGFEHLRGDLISRVTDYLYANARQRVSWQHIRRMMLVIPLVVAVVAWAVSFASWSVVTNVLCGATLAAIAVVTWPEIVRRRVVELPSTRLRFRDESRVKTRERRADNRRDIKVAFFSAIGTLVVIVIVWLVWGEVSLR